VPKSRFDVEQAPVIGQRRQPVTEFRGNSTDANHQFGGHFAKLLAVFLDQMGELGRAAGAHGANVATLYVGRLREDCG
jgi:hypothetical protein